MTTPGVSDNGAWEYGWLPDLSDPASSFTMDNIVTLMWAGIDGFSGHYSDTGDAIVLGNLTYPPATIVQSTVSVPVGVLVSGPSGTAGTQFGTLRFIADLAGTYDVIGTFLGLDVDETTTDVHVIQVSGDVTTSLFSGNVDGYYGGDAGPKTGTAPFVPFALLGIELAAGDSLYFAIGEGDDGYYNDTTGISVRVTSPGAHYTYDSNGNLTGILDNNSITTMSYDPENRLALRQVTYTTPPAPTLSNPGFEMPVKGSGTYAYVYGPTGLDVGWTFANQSGVSGNGSGFTNANPDAPEGEQVGFIQDVGVISQVFNVATAGTVQVSFLSMQRIYPSSLNTQTFTVDIDGTIIGTFTPTAGAYASFSTSALFVATGSHVLTFTGTNTLGDNTAFIDAVTISFESAGIDITTFTYDGSGLRRSVQSLGQTAPTTFIWDGTDYLGEY